MQENPFDRTKYELKYNIDKSFGVDVASIADALEKMGVRTNMTEAEINKKLSEIADDPKKIAVLANAIPERTKEQKSIGALLAIENITETRARVKQAKNQPKESTSETRTGVLEKIQNAIFGPLIAKAMWGVPFGEQFKMWRDERKKDSK